MFKSDLAQWESAARDIAQKLGAMLEETLPPHIAVSNVDADEADGRNSMNDGFLRAIKNREHLNDDFLRDA